MYLGMWDRAKLGNGAAQSNASWVAPGSVLGPRRVIVLFEQRQHLRLVPVDRRRIPFHLGFATENVSKFERVVTGLALEVFSLLADALVAVGRVFARAQQHQVAKAVEVNRGQLNAEPLPLGMDMLHRVLRGDSVSRQLGRVIETETAAFSPENVFQFLEPVMLEASAVGLLQVIDNCVDASHRQDHGPKLYLYGARSVGQNAVHLQYVNFLGDAMKHLKDETLSIRTSAEIKQLLRKAAEREHRSVASMIEVLILSYAQQHNLQPDQINHITTQRKS